jgi:hypothetical protein
MFLKSYFYLICLYVLICISCNPTGKIKEKDIFKVIEKYENGILKSKEGYNKSDTLIEKKWYDNKGVLTNRYEYFYNDDNGLLSRVVEFGIADKFHNEIKHFYSHDKLEIGYTSINRDGYELKIVKKYNDEDRLMVEYQVSNGNITWVTIYNYLKEYNAYTTQRLFHSISDDSDEIPLISTELTNKFLYKLDSLNRVSLIIGNEFAVFRKYDSTGRLFKEIFYNWDEDDVNIKLNFEKNSLNEFDLQFQNNKTSLESDRFTKDSIVYTEKIFIKRHHQD